MAALSTPVLIEQWLYGRPESTQRAYLKDSTSALRFLGNPPLTSIDLAALQKYQVHLIQERRLEVSTVRRKIAALRSLLKFAQQQGQISRNPSVALRSPKDVQSLHEKILSREQVQSIVDAAAYDRNHAMLRFLYASGARASELCGMEWRDCLVRPDGSAVVRLLGKGQKWRSVTVPAEVWREVDRLRGERSGADRVFRVTSRQLGRIFEAAASKARLPDATPHWFRHSIISHLIEAGMPLPAVRDFAGHSNISITNIYAHASPEQNPGNYLKL
jgi:site-specific recombinase XerD